MKPESLEAAQLRIPNTEILINVVSRRVRQLGQGHRPLILVSPRMDNTEIALKEIAEGKLSYELTDAPVKEVPATEAL